MRVLRGSLAALALLALAACKKQEPEPMVDVAPPRGSTPWKIASARSAATADIAVGARVEDRPAADTGHGAELAPGTSGWTCVPDDPRTEADDPYCIDEEGIHFQEAWAAHRAPRLNGMAVAYALKGGVSASDTDPFKMAPDSGQPWIVDPPYIAIAMPSARSYTGLPTRRRADGPWVRFAGTPYAYIVIPTAGR